MKVEVRPRFILASHNAGKLAEVVAILGDVAEVIGLAAFPALTLPREEGATYEENAVAKARAVARASRVPALADDSGLEVAALGGAPGVYSNRYAGPACEPAANNAKLLRELADVAEAERRAKFVCVAALVAPDGREWLARGEVAGRITSGPRGAAGFGYDPLFVPEGEGRTFAQMTAAEKNALSHRARAFEKLRRYIVELALAEKG